VSPAECLYVGNGDGEELAGAAHEGMRAVLFTAPGEHPGQEAATWTGPRITELGAIRDLV
jgi:FMN phosphatase YigB (HAD superfamily)